MGGKGCENILRAKYWNTISSSVGWNRNPGGNLLNPSPLTKLLSLCIVRCQWMRERERELHGKVQYSWRNL